jgi:hypothetical protein
VRRFTKAIQRSILRNAALVIGGLGIAASMFPMDSQALPIFARQTGQNCVACHAGGQFPELTPYGRKFKLTGYTLGTRTDVPLAVMGVVSSARMNANGDSPENGGFPHLATASIFAGGKITDNIGLFGQWTYNGYNQGGSTYAGHSQSDQFDLRYADRFIDTNRDLIVGASLNNNPGVTDVWNTFGSAFQSTPSYVPAQNATGVPGAPKTPIIGSLENFSAGMNVYAYWNDTVYAELGGYQTGNGVFSFMSQGISDANMGTKLQGVNPYFRLALNHDWGANSAMIGLYGLNVNTYDNAPSISGTTSSYHDIGIDGQYQYILDPHMISAQFSYTKENQNYGSDFISNSGPSNPSNTLDYLRLKGTYVYQAKYGGSLGYVRSTGSADAGLYGGSSLNNSINTTMWIPEVFYMPLQNIRVGVQYYRVTQFNGASSLYDGTNNASSNNTVFFYIWGAY